MELVRIKNFLIGEGKILFGQNKFLSSPLSVESSLSCVSGYRTSISKMSDFAGNLPLKFIRFRHLGVESSAHKLPEERESENPHNVDEVISLAVGETSNIPAKVMSMLQNVPMSSEVVGSEVQKDHDLTVAEKRLCDDKL